MSDDSQKQLKIKELEEAHEKGILTDQELSKKIKALDQPEYEKFSVRKFLKGMFSLFDVVEWTKTLKEVGIFDVRKWIVYGLILGSIYGYGYFKGIGNKPVNFDMRGKEAHIALNEHYLHVLPDGSARVEDKEGRILKNISVKDIPELRKALKPIGIDVKPFFTTGGGVGRDKDDQVDGALEAGIGLSWFKFYKTHIDTWLTQKGVYLGADYQLMENSGPIFGLGKGFEAGDTRFYGGWKWKF